MKELILVIAVLAAGYFCFRFLALKRALGKAERELQEIGRELSQNRFLHLPLPDRELERFIGTVNGTLEQIRRERREYERREREFQHQIENISHDLRTPLTVILGYLGIMREMGRSGEGRLTGETALSSEHGAGGEDILAVIERNARAMERLVGQFYTYSQLNAQDYRLTPQALDAGRLLRESLAANYQILARARLEVSCQLPEHPVEVWADAEALERIFANLFQNAGRYAAGRLWIYLEERPEDVLFCFENDADGLTPETVSRLFERFYRQDKARGQGGSGLGLTVAKGLAEAMGGRMSAELISEQASKKGRPREAEPADKEPVKDGLPDAAPAGREDRENLRFLLYLQRPGRV